MFRSDEQRRAAFANMFSKPRLRRAGGPSGKTGSGDPSFIKEYKVPRKFGEKEFEFKAGVFKGTYGEPHLTVGGASNILNKIEDKRRAGEELSESVGKIERHLRRGIDTYESAVDDEYIHDEIKIKDDQLEALKRAGIIEEDEFSKVPKIELDQAKIEYDEVWDDSDDFELGLANAQFYLTEFLSKKKGTESAMKWARMELEELTDPYRVEREEARMEDPSKGTDPDYYKSEEDMRWELEQENDRFSFDPDDDLLEMQKKAKEMKELREEIAEFRKEVEDLKRMRSDEIY